MTVQWITKRGTTKLTAPPQVILTQGKDLTVADQRVKFSPNSLAYLKEK
jgi:hypothetical protein